LESALSAIRVAGRGFTVAVMIEVAGLVVTMAVVVVVVVVGFAGDDVADGRTDDAADDGTGVAVVGTTGQGQRPADE